MNRNQNISFLRMWGIPDQLPSRGSVNSSHTCVGAVGFTSAILTLWNLLTSMWKSPESEKACLAALDAFEPRKIIDVISTHISGIQELSTPSSSDENISARQRTLSAIASETAPKFIRKISEIANTNISKIEEDIKKYIEDAVESSPTDFTRILSSVTRAIDRFELPNINQKPIERLSYLVRSIESVRQHSKYLRKITCDTVLQVLREKAVREYALGIEALSNKTTKEVLQSSFLRLKEFIEEVAAKGGDIIEKTRQVQNELELRVKASSEQHENSRASVVLLLDGPGEKEILAGIKSRLQRTSLHEVVKDIRDVYVKSLQNVAKQRYASLDYENSSLAKIVLTMGARELADVFCSVVNDTLGEGHSIYEIIDRIGVKDCAKFLWQRAEITCHLGGRDQDRFNIAPVRLAIVRLPMPVGNRDPEIRERLMNAFRSEGDCTFVDGNIADRDVSIVRAEAGWPVGIDQLNEGLILSYIESGDKGHTPHLFDIVPDSKLGRVSPSYRLLVSHDKE